MPELPEVEHYRQILQPLIFRAVNSATLTDSSFMTETDSSSTIVRASSSSSSHPQQCLGLKVTLPKTVPTPKMFPSQDEWETIVQNCFVKDIQRKGKIIRLLLCPVLMDEVKKQQQQQQQQQPQSSLSSSTQYFLYMHMGMTGRISSPNQRIPTLQSLENNSSKTKDGKEKETSYPPPHTHVLLTATHNQYLVAFSDPRRFGGISLVPIIHDHDPTTVSHGSGRIPSSSSSLHQQWLQFAPDILDTILTSSSSQEEEEEDPYSKLVGKNRGIKTLLLDQRYAVSGIGNWIADEVLYQSHIHPDQMYLTMSQVQSLQQHLLHIVHTAIQCNIQGHEYPSSWIFHPRWLNNNNKKDIKDSKGRKITFVTSAGRTSAIVPSIQKKRIQKLNLKEDEEEKKTRRIKKS